MYLSNIHIENFKGIKNADIDFDRSVNLVIGNNGTGKTSVLEAIAVALGGFLSGIDGVNCLQDADLREGSVGVGCWRKRELETAMV